MNHLKPVALMTILLLLLPLSAVFAGIFDEPENLEVLPEDISAEDLRATMRGFAFALGARCETCHVAEDPADMETFDFAADDKDEKRKARVMLEMVSRINSDLLSPLDEFDGERISVQCVTCHRGQRKPKMTAQVLSDAYDENGLNAALAKYDELRKEYYGSHTFDFSEYVLTEYAGNLARQGKADGAIAFLKKNAGFYPDSMMTYFTLGEVYNMSGDVGDARTAYEKALEIDPQADWVKKRLAEL